MYKKLLECIYKLRKAYRKKKAVQYYRIDNERNLLGVLDGSIDTMLIVVAFNNVNVIEKQTELVKRFCTDSFIYVVVDNSSEQSKRKQIKDVCDRKNVRYVALPQNNPFNGFDASASHGVALNYAWKNIVETYAQIRYVMLLDHDIFPVECFSVVSMLGGKSFYGLIKKREKGWYLWPGFSCFDKCGITLDEMNFLPSKYGDTGSANYLPLYSKYDLKDLEGATDVYIKLNLIDVEEEDVYRDQKDNIELIDEKWLHLINAADWAGVGNMDKKFEVLLDMIDLCIDKRGKIE